VCQIDDRDKYNIIVVLVKYIINLNPNYIANCFDVDKLLSQHCINAKTYNLTTVRYTKCRVCDKKLIYEPSLFALYCVNCEKIVFNGQFIIDKSANILS